MFVSSVQAHCLLSRLCENPPAGAQLIAVENFGKEEYISACLKKRVASARFRQIVTCNMEDARQTVIRMRYEGPEGNNIDGSALVCESQIRMDSYEIYNNGRKVRTVLHPRAISRTYVH